MANPEREAYAMYKDKLKGYDVIHDHSWRAYCYLYKMNEDPNIKIIKTIHGMLPFRSAPPVKTPNLVGVSKSHALFLASQLGVATRHVYNGIQTERFDWTKAERGERYLHLNRIQPIKGAMQFVDLMLKTRSFGDVVGDDSVLAGRSLEEMQYIERVREKCDGHFVRYFGKVSHERKVEFLRKCKAVICLPIPPYCEVYGLSACEALSFGKPVIALRTPGFFSGLAEIVEHGKSGFVAESLDEVEKLIREDAVSSLKSEDCRKRAEQFDYTIMAKNYLELYKEAMSGGW
jgi:glycosyltransferase involved in cell wall biosynthesis